MRIKQSNIQSMQNNLNILKYKSEQENTTMNNHNNTKKITTVLEWFFALFIMQIFPPFFFCLVTQFRNMLSSANYASDLLCSMCLCIEYSK